jgi:hypothetical protein
MDQLSGSRPKKIGKTLISRDLLRARNGNMTLTYEGVVAASRLLPQAGEWSRGDSGPTLDRDVQMT